LNFDPFGIKALKARVAALEARDEKWRRKEEKRIEASIWSKLKEDSEEMGEEEKSAWESGTDYDSTLN